MAKIFFLEHVPAHLEIFEIVPLFLASNRMYFAIPISGDYPAVTVGFQPPVLTITLGFGKKKSFKSLKLLFIDGCHILLKPSQIIGITITVLKQQLGSRTLPFFNLPSSTRRFAVCGVQNKASLSVKNLGKWLCVMLC